MKMKLAAVAVALLLVGTGAAVATPGNAPDSAPADDHAQSDDRADDEQRDEDESDDADESGADETDAADERRGPPADAPAASAADDGSQGPPTDMPAQVPGFVSDIHEVINAYLDGSISGAELGERISSMTPDDGADGDATETQTSDGGQ